MPKILTTAAIVVFTAIIVAAGTTIVLQSTSNNQPNPNASIADEQHRFGVEQRAALRHDANYLMLTATPIPPHPAAVPHTVTSTSPPLMRCPDSDLP